MIAWVVGGWAALVVALPAALYVAGVAGVAGVAAAYLVVTLSAAHRHAPRPHRVGSPLGWTRERPEVAASTDVIDPPAVSPPEAAREAIDRPTR